MRYHPKTPDGSLATDSMLPSDKTLRKTLTGTATAGEATPPSSGTRRTQTVSPCVIWENSKKARPSGDISSGATNIRPATAGTDQVVSDLPGRPMTCAEWASTSTAA